MSRWFILLLALLFVCPAQSEAQTVVRRSDLTVMLDGELCYLHTVRRKETLYSIAAAYGTTVKDIVDRNPFAQNEIRQGQTLLISAAKKEENTADKPAVKAEPATHKPFIEPVPLSPTLGEPDLEYGDQGEEVGAEVGLSDSAVERIVFGPTKPIDRYRPIKVVMMLPFAAMKSESNFVDFFRGASLAFDQIEASGTQMIVDVISTGASSAVVRKMIDDGRLNDADLIIGPVYAEVFEIVADYAAARRIPIVSPLGGTGSANNAMVVEVAPSEATKWDKLIPLLTDPRNNVILFTSSTATDTAALLQLQQILPANVQTIDYQGKATSLATLSGALQREQKNVIVAPLSDESLIENLLSRYSSINVSGRNDITVIGTSRWGRFNNMSLELFFKLSVVYPTTYFFDRLDENVGMFYRQYVSRYSSLPTLYSFRGYDVMQIFGGAIAAKREQMLYSIVGAPIKVLQMPYRFAQSGDDASKIVNSEWGLVQYLPSYKIEVR